MEYADFILKGRVLTTDCSRTQKGYVVVKGNRIIKNSAGEPEACFINENTKIYDFENKMIVPGFHDSHTHILQGTLLEEGAFLRDANSEEKAAAMLYREISSKNYDLFWILGGAWDHFKWEGRNMPQKQSLDKYFPDRPVFLLNKECHGAWVNSMALDYFNITKDTPDPPNGKIFRDEEGNPSGYLHEDAALNVISLIYDISDFEHLELVKKFSKRTASNGITSVSDMQIYNIMKYHGYKELENRGELSVRVHFCPSITENIEKLKYLKKVFDSPKLQFSGAKGFVDGTPMGYTGLMIEEYADVPGFCGEPTMEPQKLKQIVSRLDKEGIRCRLHACGDGAVRLALDCYEEAMNNNGTSGLRHTIEHIECMKPEDALRFKKAGVIAAVQPDHMPKYDFKNHPFQAILGPDRLNEAWPFHTIEENGGILSFGTDYPVAPLNPLRGIFRAVTRCTDDPVPEMGFSETEKISLQNALKAYTYGSAYCNFREKELGTLEEGKLADIAVLSRDLFECDPMEIKSTEVIFTILDGQVIYEKGSEGD